MITVFVLLAVSTAFLSKELIKKFSIMKFFYETSSCRRDFLCPSTRNGDIAAPGMRNVVVRSADGRDFGALIGLPVKFFGIKGYDWYGYARSKNGEAVFRLYLGSLPNKAQFLLSENVDVTITSDAKDQSLEPACVCKPHWWQRLGISYGYDLEGMK